MVFVLILFFNAAIYLFQKISFCHIHIKNGTPIHIAAPSQHKHKIKTRQNYYAIYLLCRGGIFTDSYILAYLQVVIRRFAYIKHSYFGFVHEKRCFIFIFSLYNLSGKPSISHFANA